MLTVKKVSVNSGEEHVKDAVVLHAPVYTLHCEDVVGNPFEIETNKETAAQVEQFLNKLKEV